MSAARLLRRWALLAGCAVAAATGAQQAAPTSEPSPLPDFAPLPVGAQLATRDAGLRAAALMESLQAISALTLARRPADEVLWGRLPGSEADHAAADYVRSRFSAAGLSDVHVDRVPLGPQWHIRRLQLELLDSTGTATALPSAFAGDHSPATPLGGIAAELVWGGQGEEVDLVGKDLKGKGVVIRSILRPASFFSTGRAVAATLAARGAAFVVEIMDVPENGQFLLPGQKDARIPVFTVSNSDGARLRRALASGAARARAELVTDEQTGLVTQNVLGFVRGRSDDTVVVMAHLDSYFVGANDNGSGVGTMLALAEHIARGRRPQKSYLFLATGGHHAEEFSPGTKDVIARYRSFLDHSVLVLNCEHIAPVGTQLWLGAAAMRGGVQDGRHAANSETPKLVGFGQPLPELRRLLGEAIDRYGVTVERRPWSSTPGDATPMQMAGLPTVQLIDVGYWYHSSLDTPDTVSANGMERVARAYADFLQAVDRTPGVALRRH